MTTEPETAAATSANDGDEKSRDSDGNSNSTVQTDDDEFSEFISSKWKDGVEVGLVIEYPLPHTNYLPPPAGEEGTIPSVIGSDGVESEQPAAPADNNIDNTLPPLELSTVLQEGSIAPLFDGTQWAGTRVWKAAVLGLEYLLRERRLCRNGVGGGSSSSSSSSLLELGCGLGVPGMVWKRVLDAERGSGGTTGRVVLTDRDSLLSQLRSNVESNFPDDPSIEARALDWSREGIRSLLETEREKTATTKASDDDDDGGDETDRPVFDVCLNCDCVYEPLYGRDAWESLADVLSEVASRSPNTLLVTALERRNGDNAEGFFERLGSYGTVSTPIRRAVRDATDPHHVIEIYVTKGIAAVSGAAGTGAAAAAATD